MISSGDIENDSHPLPSDSVLLLGLLDVDSARHPLGNPQFRQVPLVLSDFVEIGSFKLRISFCSYLWILWAVNYLLVIYPPSSGTPTSWSPRSDTFRHRVFEFLVGILSKHHRNLCFRSLGPSLFSHTSSLIFPVTPSISNRDNRPEAWTIDNRRDPDG